MNAFANFFPLCIGAVAIGIILYLFDLLRRFVAAQERIATSLDLIARKLQDETKS